MADEASQELDRSTEEAGVEALADEKAEVVDPSESEVLEAAIIAAQFSGPLPPPEILQAYDEVVEGGANRIIDQWERETKHRHSLERKALDAYVAGMTRAQWMAFIVIFSIGVGGLVIVALGHALVGVAGFLLALAAAAATFFRGRDAESETEEDPAGN
jgi:uncharacterized membrane protein